MLNRSRFLRIHGVTVEAWAARHGIEPEVYPCSECGALCTMSIPFAVGELRGLMCPRCPCGNEHTPYCVVRDSKYGDLLNGGPLVESKP